MLLCSSCNTNKSYEFFHKCSRTKRGYQVYCKSCKKIKEDSRGALLGCTVKVEEQKCSKCDVVKSVDYFAKDKRLKAGVLPSCKECKSKYDTERYMKDDIREKRKANSTIYRIKNPVKVAKIKHECYLAIKFTDSFKKKNREYQKERRKDPFYRLIQSLRGHVHNALNRIKADKTKGFNTYIGCSVQDFKDYLEKQFEPGMTWKNYGVNGWHVDHIKPLHLAKTTEEVNKLNHYTNLRPLWALDNLRKGKKYDGNTMDDI